MKRTQFAQPAGCMVGHQVNGAVVIEDAGTRYSSKQKFWKLRCACGNEFQKSGSVIRREPETIRCKTCAGKAISEKIKTHGETKNYLFRTWENMRRRCYDKNMTNYKYWGGRGVRVHQPWRDSYVEFAAYVRSTIGERPSEDHSIDRIENDGNYEPGNIKWSTRKEQSNNRRAFAKRNPT